MASRKEPRSFAEWRGRNAVEGYVVDALARRGMDAVKVRKVSVVSGMLLFAAFTTFVTRATDTTSAVT